MHVAYKLYKYSSIHLNNCNCMYVCIVFNILYIYKETENAYSFVLISSFFDIVDTYYVLAANPVLFLCLLGGCQFIVAWMMVHLSFINAFFGVFFLAEGQFCNKSFPDNNNFSFAQRIYVHINFLFFSVLYEVHVLDKCSRRLLS